jgi:hypothetical protein
LNFESLTRSVAYMILLYTILIVIYSFGLYSQNRQCLTRCYFMIKLFLLCIRPDGRLKQRKEQQVVCSNDDRVLNLNEKPTTLVNLSSYNVLVPYVITIL